MVTTDEFFIPLNEKTIPDFTLTTGPGGQHLTADGTQYTLDLSSLIPNTAKFVKICVYGNSPLMSASFDVFPFNYSMANSLYDYFCLPW